MYRYIYDGPVKEFNKVITEKLKGETMAVSEKRASDNLAFQFKREFGKSLNSKISFFRKNNVYRYGGMDL